jgi:PD-(D/E)XK endonuclease
VSESTWKGAIAEAAITLEASKLGIPVLTPNVEGQRYDIVLDVSGQLLRVQCKWATRKRDVVTVYTGTCRHTPSGYVRTTYDATQIDGIAAYCKELERCYFVPIQDVEGKYVLHLRLAPARNNQLVGVKWAADYEFGAVAQLGERRHGMAEVRGSSPLSSTTQSPLSD